MIYNTELVLQAIGVDPPKGKAAKADTFCCCCGKKILAGEDCLPFGASDGFMGQPYFAVDSGVYCPYCAGAFDTRTIRKMGARNSIVYTTAGAFPISKDEHRQHFLMTPPQPPFIVTASATSNYQHVVWKTPVTLSLDMIYVGWPNRTMTIRHPVLMQAVHVAQSIGKAMAEARKTASKKKGDKLIPHPYRCLDRNLTDLGHGRIRPDALSLARENDDVRNGLDFLSKLSLGETWALATLAKTKPDPPVRPEMFPLFPRDILHQ